MQSLERRHVIVWSFGGGGDAYYNITIEGQTCNYSFKLQTVYVLLYIIITAPRLLPLKVGTRSSQDTMVQS